MDKELLDDSELSEAIQTTEHWIPHLNTEGGKIVAEEIGRSVSKRQHAKTKAHYEAEIRGIFEEIEIKVGQDIRWAGGWKDYQAIKSRYIEEE